MKRLKRSIKLTDKIWAEMLNQFVYYGSAFVRFDLNGDTEVIDPKEIYKIYGNTIKEENGKTNRS